MAQVERRSPAGSNRDSGSGVAVEAKCLRSRPGKCKMKKKTADVMVCYCDRRISERSG